MIVTGLDIESTGLLSPDHRMIEVAVQKWHLDTRPGAGFNPTLVGEATWRFHPDRSIEAKAQAVHNISLDDLAGQPKLGPLEVEAILNGIGDSDRIVAHNGEGFDKPFVRFEIERVHPTTLPRYDKLKWFDTMLEGRWAHPWGKVPALKEIAWACDVDYDTTKAHAALYDVSVMMKCFFFGLKWGVFQVTT